MFNLYSNLRKLYPVQKTLRFELIPPGQNEGKYVFRSCNISK